MEDAIEMRRNTGPNPPSICTRAISRVPSGSTAVTFTNRGNAYQSKVTTRGPSRDYDESRIDPDSAWPSCQPWQPFNTWAITTGHQDYDQAIRLISALAYNNRGRANHLKKTTPGDQGL